MENENQNSNANLRNQANIRERIEERRENRETRDRENRDNRERRQNNNSNILLACVPLLAGLNRNNNVIINQQETEKRDFSVNFIPSSIQIFSTQTNVIDSGDQVVFDTQNLNTGVSYTYGFGNEITIISAGVYIVTFGANISSTNGTQTAELAIAVDGVPYTFSQISQIVATNQIYNVKAQLLIKVTNPPVNISVLNVGADAISVSNANLLITKTANF